MKAGLEKAIKLALEAHWGQKDKGGQPYILHPIRLMLKQKTPEEQVTALLHDVVEDSGITIEAIKEAGFSRRVIRAVECLTKSKNTSYDKYILKISKNPLAVKIKLADLKDNMQVSRLKKVSASDKLRLQRYRKAYNMLKPK